MDLVHREWKTDDTVASDAQGFARVRGFCGDYAVAVSHGSAATTTVAARLARAGAEVSVVLEGRA
jgi:hypothetical protein